MAVYKRTYKTYQGAQIPGWSRFWVLTRYSLAEIFKSRVFTWFTALCMFPFVVGVAFIYFAHSETAQALLNLQMGGAAVAINNVWFSNLLTFQAWIGFFVVAWAAPGIVTKDFANHALQLYLSRPLSRAEYLLGKASALAVVLSFFTWVPGLLLFGLQAQLEGHGWGWSHFYMIGAILLSGWLWIAVVSLMALALSVWVRWRIAATGLIVGSILLLPGFGLIADAILRVEWGRLMSVPYVMEVIWMHLFRADSLALHRSLVDRVPLWSAWATVLTICLMSFGILNLRLKAREVERG